MSDEKSLMEQELGQDVHGTETEKGPADKTRKCTDVPCCLIFLGYLCAMGYFVYYALENGNINKLTHGYDWRGHICGVSNSTLDKPFLYWCATTATTSGGKLEYKISDGICVKSCPTSTDTKHQCPSTPQVKRAVLHNKDGSKTIQDIVQREVEDTPDQKTQAVLGMYCLPTESKEMMKQIFEQSGTGGYGQQALTAAHGVYRKKNFLGVVAGLSILSGYVFLFLLKISVKPLVYTFLFLVWLGLGSIVGLAALAYTNPSSEYNVFHVYVSSDHAAAAAIASGVVGLVLWLLFSCVACKAHNSIHITLQSIKESCDVIVAMPTLLLQPLITIILKLAALGVLLYGLAWIMSLGELETTNPFQTAEGVSISGLHRSMTFKDWQKYWIAIFVFGIVWFLEVITALSQFAICCAVVKFAIWKKKECLPLAHGYANGIFHHLGSLAFGGFIIGALKVATAVCAYISRTMETNPDGSQNGVIKVICCCVICCLSCLTRVVEMLNEMVYVDICITGSHYMAAASSVVKMLASDPVTFAIVHGATRFVRVLGTLVLGGGGTWLVYFYLEHPFAVSLHDEALTASPMLDQSARIGTTIAAGLICFAIAHSFMVVFDMAAGAQMYCILWKQSVGHTVEHPDSWKMARGDAAAPKGADGEYAKM